MSPIGRHAPGERLPRHRHAEGYVALVLDGGYEEAGDEGRLSARPGTVVVHGPHSAHLDRFGLRGARVLNLPLAEGLAAGAGSVADPDAIARLAECDPVAATDLLAGQLRPGATLADDWPDRLAAALRDDPMLILADWADAAGLNPASVSRGFARAYGVSPKRFRLEARARRAALALSGWRGSIAGLAAEHGFADQAHLARSILALTGTSPQRLRAKSVQSTGIAAR